MWSNNYRIAEYSELFEKMLWDDLPRAPHKRRSGGTPDTKFRRRRKAQANKFPGGHRSRVTPVRIPNTQVTPATADGTARVGAWESRSVPGIHSTVHRTVRQYCSLSEKSLRLFSCTPITPWRRCACARPHA